MYCMVSYMAAIADSGPSGELMYNETGRSGSFDSGCNNCPAISSTAVVGGVPVKLYGFDPYVPP
ncbi:MAG: hypothetical protein JWQ60_1691 [Pseudonocardia sp.]|nr:hypothetical protein [Pseudonocardia sp.]